MPPPLLRPHGRVRRSHGHFRTRSRGYIVKVKVPPQGPIPARILIVGEAPGANEVRSLVPFVGASGQELDRMLHEANILRTECFITNVCKYQPPGNDMSKWLFKQKTLGQKLRYSNRFGLYMAPEIVEGLIELQKEIAEVKPNVIIALGATALWALTGETAITSWRGSLVQSLSEFGNRKVIPTYHPAAILRMWEWRHIAVHDLRRAERESHNPFRVLPKYNFILRPSFMTAKGFFDAIEAKLRNGPIKLAVDIETRLGHIACIGFATSKTDAMCLPLMCVEDELGYWSEAEELYFIQKMGYILSHRNAQIIGQNYLYDAQYIVRHWGIWSHVYMDTMIAHHTCWPGTPKGLDFLSSLYCENHIYWKDEGKNWDPSMSEEQLWTYNCKDAVATFEVAEVLEGVIDSCNVRDAYAIQMRLFDPVLTMMLRGVRINKQLKANMGIELLDAAAPREGELEALIGRYVGVKKVTKTTAPWYRSPKQTATLFYDELKLPVQLHKKSKKPTVDDEALKKLGETEPLVYPLTKTISELRSIGVFFSTFVQAAASHDGRMRTSYGIAGPETFRFNSSEDAFGSGMNLQNIPSGSKE